LTRSSRRNTARCSWESSELGTIIDVLTSLPDDNVSEGYAKLMVAKGQVKLGSYTFGMTDWERPLSREKCYGKMLVYGGRFYRLIGSQRVTTDQLELAS
jgi:Mor family transcriptional regulator